MFRVASKYLEAKAIARNVSLSYHRSTLLPPWAVQILETVMCLHTDTTQTATDTDSLGAPQDADYLNIQSPQFSLVNQS